MNPIIDGTDAEKREENKKRIAEEPTLSTRRLSNQVGVSTRTVRRCLKSLKLLLYKITVLHQLLPTNYEKRVHYFVGFEILLLKEVKMFLTKFIFRTKHIFTCQGTLILRTTDIGATRIRIGLKRPHCIHKKLEYGAASLRKKYWANFFHWHYQQKCISEYFNTVHCLGEPRQTIYLVPTKYVSKFNCVSAGIRERIPTETQLNFCMSFSGTD